MDWIAFFEDNFIPFVTQSSGTKKGEISTRCPMCGSDDNGTHMGISLTASLWGCWRNPQHRGKNPTTLVQAYLGCTWSQAKLAVNAYTASNPDTLGVIPPDWLEATSEAPRAASEPFTVPPWRPITPDGATQVHWRYLERRGFDDVGRLVKLYSLKACLTGDYKGRVIVPFHQGGSLVGITGRAIGSATLRYLSSGKAVKTTVFNEDELREGGKTLYVVEGPFDALKVDFYGRDLGVRATCAFGVSLTMDQSAIIAELSKGFDQTVVLFDHDAIEPAYLASDWIPGSTIGQLPDGVDDPGELDKKQVMQLGI